jgi:hypothetical protein
LNLTTKLFPFALEHIVVHGSLLVHLYKLTVLSVNSSLW